MRFIMTTACGAALVGGTAALGGQATFQLLPVNVALEITIDEFDRTLVLVGDGGGAYIWEDGFLTFVGAIDAWGLSADGNTVSGTQQNVDSDLEAARWTASGGVQLLGPLFGSTGCDAFLSGGYRCSADGNTVVGNGWDGCDSRAIAWRSGTGMIALEAVGFSNARASDVSDDGETVVGFTQGNFNRTPAVWNVSTTLLDPLYPFDLSVVGELWAATPEGRTVVGQWGREDVTGFTVPAMYWNADEGVRLLGWLDGDELAQAYDVSANGRTIVGNSGTVFTGFDAFIWTPEAGIQKLADRLVADGANLGDAAFLGNALAVSSDGRKIVGYAFVPPAKPGELGQNRGFIATIDPDPNPCPPDFNGDGFVGFGDLTQLLNNWGPCTCVEDLDLDNAVGFSDLTTLLNAWGPCP